jgi:metallo-beta-lactamase class B
MMLVPTLLAATPAVSQSSRAAAPSRQASPRTLIPDPPSNCPDCAAWNGPRKPFQVYANTYFVGPAALSSLLVVTSQGLVLLDGALAESAPVIDANIRTLGFRTTDIRYILTSHAHHDHVGGVHALQRYTGATVVASSSTARALALGHPTPDDPQFARVSHAQDFPRVESGVRIVANGDTVGLGGVTFTAHATPGHTPGSTTWTWDSCEAARCLHLVYADSLTAVSTDTFRFTGDATRQGIVETFRRSIATVSALPCDILVSTHPDASGLDEKLKLRQQRGAAPGSREDPFVDSGSCRAYAANALRGLDERVRQETSPGR